MTQEIRVMLSIGTRPEIIKMAPLYFELKKRGMKPILLHTGQHNEMASSLYDLFNMVPDFDLMSHAYPKPANDEEASAFCQLSAQSGELLQKISTAMMQADPQLVLVHGDTSSALMSALAAFYQKRSIAHIEAGLRSGNEYNPFPEEKNRVLIGKLAHWHFAPTAGAKANLLEEGVPADQIHMVGNTIVEAARLGVDKLQDYQGTEEDTRIINGLKHSLESKRLMMVTVHRRENHGSNIKSITKAIVNLMRKHPDMVVVWPVHPNPKVSNAVRSAFADVPSDVVSRLHLTEPLNYPVFLWVLKHSWAVLTDSGGVQEEAVALNTPVLVLRNTTERPEIIEIGAGLMAGTIAEDIVSHVDMLLSNTDKYNAMCNAENPFGNGTTAASICDILIKDNFSERKYA